MSSTTSSQFKPAQQTSKKKRRKSSQPNVIQRQKEQQKVPFLRRLNSKYIAEEEDIQNILSTRQDNLDDDLKPSKSDLEILFFTSGLPNEKDDDVLSEIVGTDQGSTQSPLSPDIHETPSNLMESYVQIEDESLFKRVSEEFVYEEDLIYQPSSAKPEFSWLENKIQNVKEQGLYIDNKLKVGERTMNLMCNRLIEENHLDRFDQSGELIGLKSFFEPGHGLLKYHSDKEFSLKLIQNHESELKCFEKLDHEKTLIVYIGTVKFKHHHLFSEETLQASKVEELYSTYLVLDRKSKSGKLKQRIEILRDSINKIEDDSTKSEDWVKLKGELKILRDQFHLESKAIILNTKLILEEYKKLKSLRKSQQFNSTDLKLVISIDESHIQNQKDEWKNMFDNELDEVYDEELQEYLVSKQERKKLKRQLPAEELKHLPEAEKPNKELLKKKLIKIYKECHSDPAEPKIEIFMKNIPKKESKNNQIEEKRLSQISGTKFYLRIFFNNHLVGIIRNGFLNDDFDVHFNSSISIKLTKQLPDQIRIDLVEERPLKPKIKLSKLFLPVPPSNECFDDVSSWTQLEFSSQKQIQRDVGVGSGQFCIRNGQEVYTAGVLQLKYGWKEIFENETDQDNRLSGSANWINDNFDPMNPDLNENLFKGGQNNEEIEESDEDGDEFYFNEEELTVCTEEELDNNPRMKILIERAKNNMKYKDMKLIPQLEREIIEREEQPEKIIDDTLGMDPIDLQRFRGKKYLSEVYSTISNHCKILGIDNDDCRSLLSDQIPTFGAFLSAIWNFFGPNRPLKPTRKTHSSRHSCRITDITKFGVTITFIRAFSIPQRQDENIPTRRISNISTPQSGYRTANVKPFISVSFKDFTARTSTADGCNPTWNEQLTVPFNLKKLEEWKGFLVINLFDEFVDDILEDDRNRFTEIYQRISSKWLGELRIPIADIYFNQRIEGTFELSSPPIILGYSKTTLSSPQNPSISNSHPNFMPDFRGPIYLSILINLEPNLEIPFFTTKYLECTEADEIKSIMDLWMLDYRSEFPERQFDPFVTLLNGKRVNIMNLFGPVNIPFPTDFNTPEVMENLLRRYVSLIPTHSTIDHCIQLNGIWLLNDQIFKLMKGSPKDFAVLLVNFYLKMEFESWLMIGESQMSANSCFVLLKASDADFVIINPVTGQKYQSTDTYCPLNKIFFLVNDKNIYGNIQIEKRVFMTKFDVTQSSEWRPIFKKTHEFIKGCIQDPMFTFKRAYDIRNIQFMIELKLTKKISQWRGHRKTTWNRYIRDNLRKVLVDLERDSVQDKDITEHMDKLNHLHTTHKLTGFPLNMRYINLSHIVDKIKSTGIHLNTDSKAEFALAVYVHPYPHYVISIWVFLVACVAK